MIVSLSIAVVAAACSVYAVRALLSRRAAGEPEPFSGAYAAAVDLHLDGLWDWRVSSNVEHYSNRFAQQMGYHSLPPDPSWWQENIHPDDLARSLDLWGRHVGSGGKVPYDLIVRYRRKDSSEAVIHCRGQVTDWDENGEPVRAQGVHADLTRLLPSAAVAVVVSS